MRAHIPACNPVLWTPTGVNVAPMVWRPRFAWFAASHSGPMAHDGEPRYDACMRAHQRYIAASVVLVGFLVWACASVELGAVPVANAQSTGGSMGGGSFGSSGGSFGSSGGSFGSSGGSFGSSGGSFGYSSSRGYSSGTSMGCDNTGYTVFMFVLFAVVIATNIMRRARASGAPVSGVGPSVGGAIDVTVLRVVVDWRERKFIQAELERIARTANTSTTPGLVRMLREVTVVLRRVRDAWLYAGIVNARPMRAPDAEAWFQQHAQDARTRFREELIRNAEGGVVTRAAGALDARSDEGEGLVVITLIVAARGHLLDFHDLADAEQVRRCLESLGNLTSVALTAVEIVWSPAAENDRLSSAELAHLDPDVHKIRGSSMAGRIHCEYCGGPFPAELLSCPHCGARVLEQSAS